MPKSNLPSTPIEKRALTVKEVTAGYNLSHSTIYKLMSEGKLRSVKIGGRRLIPVEAAEALLREGAR